MTVTESILKAEFDALKTEVQVLNYRIHSLTPKEEVQALNVRITVLEMLVKQLATKE